MPEKQLVGIEVVDKSLSLEGQDVVGKIAVEHVGKVGSLKLSFEGKIEFLPLVGKLIDKIEELIPGDQKALAAIAKDSLSKIKIKF